MHAIANFELNQADAQRLQLKAGQKVRVTSGRLWLTLQGCADDIWLRAGDCWTAPAHGTAWLSAEPVAAFQVLQVVPQSGFRAPSMSRSLPTMGSVASV